VEHFEQIKRDRRWRDRASSKLARFDPLIDHWLAGEPSLLATRIRQDLVRD
jgi:hypothetical protein